MDNGEAKKPGFDVSRDPWIEELLAIANSSEDARVEIQQLFDALRTGRLIQLLDLIRQVELKAMYGVTAQGNYTGDEAVRVLAFYKGVFQVLSRLTAIAGENKSPDNNPVARGLERLKQEGVDDSVETY